MKTVNVVWCAGLSTKGYHFFKQIWGIVIGLFLITPAIAHESNDLTIPGRNYLSTRETVLNKPGVIKLGDDIGIEKIAHNVWRHITYEVIRGGRDIESNGLIIKTDKGVTLVDTGWKIEHTRKVLDWVERDLRAPVIAGVVTHSHKDRMGGIEVWLEKRIPVHGSYLTADIVSRLPEVDRLPPPNKPFVFAERISDEIELHYLGPGHSIDNIVVWLPQSKILFGGCLIKAKGWPLEPVPGSDVREWANSAARLKAERFNADIVVPGHGDLGRTDLIDLTIRLGTEEKTKRLTNSFSLGLYDQLIDSMPAFQNPASNISQ